MLYRGREQAYVKHTILKTYLQRLIMIIGRTELEINYVDCFAGPWSEESDDLRDTSIGISLELMEESAISLKSTFGRNVRFRALYIEKDPKAFQKLKQFLQLKNFQSVTAECLEGDYVDYIPDIVQWAGGAFTFFFVDPKGWKRVINASVMKPLLKMKKVEFLINLMYDFFNRALSIESQQVAVTELLGINADISGVHGAIDRQSYVLDRYRSQVNTVYGGRSAYVAVDRPGTERVLYFLVYLSRHPLGIKVFKEEAEKMEMVQRVSHLEIKLRQQVEKAQMADLFATDTDISNAAEYHDNRLSAKSYVLSKLSREPVLIDLECWASYLEESDLYPSDLQLAFKELTKEGVIINLDKDITRRSKLPVRPDWPKKSERWALKSQE